MNPVFVLAKYNWAHVQEEACVIRYPPPTRHPLTVGQIIFLMMGKNNQ